MSHKYKVKMTSHNYPIGKIKNMVTKYQKGKSQGLIESVGELMKDFKKKGNKRKKRRKRTREGGGKKSKYNVKMARKFRRRTRRKRGRGSFSRNETTCEDLKQDVAHYKASIAVLDDNNNPVEKYQGMLREIANFVKAHGTAGQRGGAPDTPEARENRKMLETLQANAENFKRDNFYKYGLKFKSLPYKIKDPFDDKGDVTGVKAYFNTRITEIEASDLYKRLCGTEGGRKSRRRRRRRTKKRKSRRRKKRTRRRKRKKR